MLSESQRSLKTCQQLWEHSAWLIYHNLFSCCNWSGDEGEDEGEDRRTRAPSAPPDEPVPSHFSPLWSWRVSAASFTCLPKNAQHLQSGRASAREAYASMCWLRMCELQTHELCIHGAAAEERLLGLLLVKSMKRSDWSCCSVFRSLSYSERPSWCFCRLCDLSSQTHIDISIKGDYGTLAKGDLSTVVWRKFTMKIFVFVPA